MIVVAVDASKEITDHALEWALSNLIRAKDSLILLAVAPSNGRRPANRNRIQQFLSCRFPLPLCLVCRDLLAMSSVF